MGKDGSSVAMQVNGDIGEELVPMPWLDGMKDGEPFWHCAAARHTAYGDFHGFDQVCGAPPTDPAACGSCLAGLFKLLSPNVGARFGEPASVLVFRHQRASRRLASYNARRGCLAAPPLRAVGTTTSEAQSPLTIDEATCGAMRHPAHWYSGASSHTLLGGPVQAVERACFVALRARFFLPTIVWIG
eukprot:CAMPEP_0117606842 /NCGR_PEP_ID=MMETSP0784-20121206/79917_1 /TAXON_ID=39447 /ORGANISM="" /LENGTH=186 /DNA_ID=CAMNT_0005409929 /DNA_START=1 /DNA_END=559 /DNA_ORIENTATION=-